MPRMNRTALMERFQAMVRARQPILGGGAGTGLSAKCEEAGGIDLIVIYNSGRYRMAGRGSLAGMLAYGNANEIVVEMAREVLPVVRHTPVLAGVNGTDPFCHFDHFLDQLAALGFSGVQNFPTVGLIDGQFRAGLEETGMGYGLEVEMIRLAHAKDLLTTPYVFNPDEARGHGGGRGRYPRRPYGADNGRRRSAPPRRFRSMIALSGSTRSARPGAPRAARHHPALPWRPDCRARRCAEFILARCPDCHGFYGASSMERLPSEIALIERTRQFKGIARA